MSYNTNKYDVEIKKLEVKSNEVPKGVEYVIAMVVGMVISIFTIAFLA